MQVQQSVCVFLLVPVHCVYFTLMGCPKRKKKKEVPDPFAKSSHTETKVRCYLAFWHVWTYMYQQINGSAISGGW